MEKTPKTGEDPGRNRGQVGAPTALVTAGLLAAVAVLFLGVVVVFGPQGFGGDGTPTHSELLRSNIGEWAGCSALALAFVALVAALLIKAPARDRVLEAVVACEAGAVLVLVWSTLS